MGISKTKRYSDSISVDQQKITDNFTSTIIYEGLASTTAATSDAKWKLRRISTNLNVVTETLADNGNYSQIWDNRSDIFGDVSADDNRYSVLFGGTDEFMTTDSPGVTGTAARTFSAWLKTTDTNGVILSYGDNIALKRLSIQILSNAFRLESAGSYANFTATGLNDGTWRHIAITMPLDGTFDDIKGYMDATPLASSSSGGTNNYNTGTDVGVLLGKILTSSIFYEGNLDEVSIWDTDLSATEIAEIYNSGTPTNLNQHTRSQNLFNWWKMGDNSTFPTIPDNGPRQEDGELVNMEAGDIEEDTP